MPVSFIFIEKFSGCGCNRVLNYATSALSQVFYQPKFVALAADEAMFDVIDKGADDIQAQPRRRCVSMYSSSATPGVSSTGKLIVE
jgi:hypothetical protein